MLGLICKNCGGKLTMHDENFAECESCATKYYLRRDRLFNAATMFSQNELLTLSKEALRLGEFSRVLKYVNQYLLLDSKNIDALAIKYKCLMELFVEKQSIEILNDVLDVLSLLGSKNASGETSEQETIDLGDAIDKFFGYTQEQILDNPSVYFVCEKMNAMTNLISGVTVCLSKANLVTRNRLANSVIKGTAGFIDVTIFALSQRKYQLEDNQVLAEKVIDVIDALITALEPLLTNVADEQACDLRKKIVALLSFEIECNYDVWIKDRWGAFKKIAIIPNSKIEEIKSTIQYHKKLLNKEI